MNFERIATGVPGSEGPVFDAGSHLYFVAPDLGEVRTLRGGKQLLVAQTGGVPAGLQVDAEGRLWCADMKRGVLRIDPDGSVHDALTTFEGAPARGCNDLAFDDHRNLYVTAPAGSGPKPGGDVGELFFLAASGEATRLDGGFRFCNGLAVSPDGRRLVVAETHGDKELHLYDIDAPGRVSGKRTFAVMPSDHVAGADGIDFDAEGHLLATNWGGDTIDVFDANGGLVERIRPPFQHPSNLHLGGPDGRDLVVTEHGTQSIWIGRWRAPGVRLRDGDDAKGVPAAPPLHEITP